MRYFVELSYNGANYCGWQRQPNAPSVQQTVEEALSRLLGGPIEVTGAGRTDTGVHAAYYVAHFDTAVVIGNNFLYHANSILPPDIALRGIRRVSDNAHARFDAREREYTYYVLPFKDPFRSALAWQYTVPLDVEAMNRAAAYLLTVSDFATFAKLGGNNKTNLCRVTVAEWQPERRQRIKEEITGEGPPLSPCAFPRQPAAALSASVDEVDENEQPEGGALVFTIRADRFLRNMVRAIVGTLVDVGRGKITPEQFAEIVAAKDLSRSSGGAPAHGLFLTDIKY